MFLLAVLEYDGTEFIGFQRQKHGRSVQEELERALGEFGQKPVRIVGGGRTDAGVHAAGQTASFKIEWTHDLETLQRAINAKLPRDLAVKSLRVVPENFSARYSAQSRVYDYTIWNYPVRSPLGERYRWWIAERLDVASMMAASQLLIGTHDFCAFGTSPRGGSTVREMKGAAVWRAAEQVICNFEANAFLYRMVRRLVGTLVQVGRGDIGLNEFREVLEQKRRAGDAAPAQGLCLSAIKYDFDNNEESQTFDETVSSSTNLEF